MIRSFSLFPTSMVGKSEKSIILKFRGKDYVRFWRFWRLTFPDIRVRVTVNKRVAKCIPKTKVCLVVITRNSVSIVNKTI